MDFPIEADWIEEAPAAAGSGDRLPVPEGVHEFTIKQLTEDATKLELRLVHEDRRFGWVFVTIPKPPKYGWQKALVGQLAGCLCMTPEQWSAADPGDFAGNRVTAEIRHKTATNGKVFVNVWAFIPTEPKPATQPTRPPAARTPHQKAKAAARANGEVPDDEIPF